MRTPLKYIYLTQGYGFTDNPDTKGWYKNGFHYGLDFRAPIGTIVYAPIDGYTKTYITDGGGLSLEIVKGQEKVFICHLSECLVEDDVKVKAGEPIAKTGNSGKMTTGSHLHLSYLINGKQQDPTMLFDQLWEGTKINPKDFEKSFAYHRYGKKQNWLAEFNLKFKNPWLHRKMTQRFGYAVPGVEIVNGLCYGGWSWEEVANDANYQTWSRQTKY